MNALTHLHIYKHINRAWRLQTQINPVCNSTKAHKTPGASAAALTCQGGQALAYRARAPEQELGGLAHGSRHEAPQAAVPYDFHSCSTKQQVTACY
jgi:hypothetical protein